MKMYYKLPDEAKRTLLYMDYEKKTPEPYALTVVSYEVRNNTELGKRIIADLGYVDT